MKTERMARLLARRLKEEGERTGTEVSVEDLLQRYVPYRAARRALELTTKSEYDLLVLEFLSDRRLTVLDDPAVAEAAARELDTPEPDLGPLEEHADAALRLDLATISGGYSGVGQRPADGQEARGGAGAGAGGAGGGAGDGAGIDRPPADDRPTGSDPGRAEEPEGAEDGQPGDDSDGGEAGTRGERREGASPGGGEGGWDPTGGVDARPGGAAPPSGEAAGIDGADGADDSGEAGGAEREGAGDEKESECRRCGESLPVEAGVPVRFCPHCGTSRPERACPECDTALEPGWTYCPACGARASPSGGGAA